jgi:hypothetical protein
MRLTVFRVSFQCRWPVIHSCLASYRRSGHTLVLVMVATGVARVSLCVCGRTRAPVRAPGAGVCDRGATKYFVEPTIRGRECGRARHECSIVRRRRRARVDVGNATSLSTRAWQSCAACVRLSIRQRALMTDRSSRHRMPALSCGNFHATGGRSVVPFARLRRSSSSR